MKITFKIQAAALALAICAPAPLSFAAEFSDSKARAVLENYADIARAGYEDSLRAARALADVSHFLVNHPDAPALSAARAAWVRARVPYMQTEAFRFGNPIVDDWEGRVNAWPLDEGLIDYVDASYGGADEENNLRALNVIANRSPVVNGETVDARSITPELLAEVLHEAGGSEANVATGYHAIEFLLWGQDLNGAGPGKGARPASDFDARNCADGNCERRGEYLEAAANLLVSDLEEMVGNWGPNGAARKALLADPAAGISAVLTGAGSLSYGELAGERMKLGLLLRDPEEEHDCFSDNTHESHYYDQIGIVNVYLGEYKRDDGSVVSGPSVADLVAEADAALAGEIREKMRAATAEMAALRTRAESREAYDQMLGENNPEGNAAVQRAIDALVAQARAIERAFPALGIAAAELEGSDSLDDPNAVFQ